MAGGSLFTFGPYRLDENRKRLFRVSEPVVLSDRQFDVLLLLIARAGQVVTKDALLDAAWKGIAVGDNSLEQVISSLRRLLGGAPDGSAYIETLARRGYRFRAAVTRDASRHSDEALDALLAPYRVFVEGRAALETLLPDEVARARVLYEDAVAAAPDSATGHLGLANALILTFESTRADPEPDTDVLRAAVRHAREACRLDPASGEGWATFAFATAQAGAEQEAAAAVRRAVMLEPTNWRHHLRAAYVTWGEERLHAAHRALQLMPGLGLAHWLAATVYVARQAFGEAVRELTQGTSTDDDAQEGARFGAVGLHLLLGLIALARDDGPAAQDAFERELAGNLDQHVYGRQARANTLCAIGSLRHRNADHDSAVTAFENALALVPAYPIALAALSILGNTPRQVHTRGELAGRLVQLRAHGAIVEAAMAESVVDALSGRQDAAAWRIHAALTSGHVRASSGWTLPVEPLLHVTAHPEPWAAALQAIRSRAV